MQDAQPIGVFDSGLGGLTVVRALRQRLPEQDVVYFGDTARLPYGTKSAQTVHRFSHECLRFLMQFRPKLLVVACNTASALALKELAGEFDVPVLGVLEPGARAAVRIAREKVGAGPPLCARVGLIATEATIGSNAYCLAVRRLDGGIHVIGRACPLLVPMIEEGREMGDPVVRLVLQEYLKPFVELKVPALVLGCTHYPILREAIQAAVGEQTALVDSAEETAVAVERRIRTMAGGIETCGSRGRGELTCYVTDQGQRFERLAGRFLGEPVSSPVWVTPEMLEAGVAS